MSLDNIVDFTPDRSLSVCYIGTILNQGFEIKSLLSRGVIGDVYLATHPQFPQEKFAIKFLSKKNTR